MNLLLQTQSSFTPISWQLPALAVGIGFMLMFAGVAGSVAAGNLTYWPDYYPTERFLILGLLTIGILFTAIPAFRSRDLLWYYAMFLVMIARSIEGALIVRFFTRVFSFLYGSSQDPLLDKIIRKFKKRTVRIIFTSIVTNVTIIFILIAFLRNPTLEALHWTAIAYSVGRFGIVSITVIYQLKDVVNKFTMLNLKFGWSIVLGLVLAIAGAEVFDFPQFLGIVQIPVQVIESPTGQIFVRFAGFIGLLAGMLIALAFFRIHASRYS
ncbi:hypothetical protein ABNG03_10120 [Halorubrum sp. RMP-47]|uniref:Uncharacterized protein n=1 Tax=Halorubrum miltondacostae TaxID=3076378 RepID=A0ABD5LYV8_9EURY